MLFASNFIARNHPDVRTLVRIAITPGGEEFRFRVLLRIVYLIPASFASRRFSRMKLMGHLVNSSIASRVYNLFSKKTLSSRLCFDA